MIKPTTSTVFYLIIVKPSSTISNKPSLQGAMPYMPKQETGNEPGLLQQGKDTEFQFPQEALTSLLKHPPEILK